MYYKRYSRIIYIYMYIYRKRLHIPEASTKGRGLMRIANTFFYSRKQCICTRISKTAFFVHRRPLPKAPDPHAPAREPPRTRARQRTAEIARPPANRRDRAPARESPRARARSAPRAPGTCARTCGGVRGAPAHGVVMLLYIYITIYISPYIYISIIYITGNIYNRNIYIW